MPCPHDQESVPLGLVLEGKPHRTKNSQLLASPLKKIHDPAHKTQALLPDAQWLYRIPVFTKGLCIFIWPSH
jgi:hypothetical protein